MKYIRLFLMATICLVWAEAFTQQPPFSHIEINNIRATIRGDGTFWVPQEGSEYYVEETGYTGHHPDCTTWEVPQGSGKETVFQHALWLGGMDEADSLRLAAFRFGQVGVDYWSGPLKTSDGSTEMMTVLKYLRIWNLTRAQINDFIAHHGNTNYSIPNDIMTWPAHGDAGYAANLAPFVDVNGDGRYHPEEGDYPDIKGDQCLFFIFNDTYASHTESGGKPVGLEAHGMVYAFDAPNDEALDNTIFFNYKFYNRSSHNYHDTYLGLWTDWDLGYGWDDFVGCDVRRGSCFAYNGTAIDGEGQSYAYWAYGDNPPVQVCTVLAGPYMDADGRDNPAYNGDCNTLFNETHPLDKYAYTGYNFGNGIVDDERLGMCGFMYHNNSNMDNGDPRTAPHFYNYMRGIWINDLPMQYGGNAFEGENVVGPECKFMFPGDSDPCNFGTNGVSPNGGYNTNGKYWTEEECGNTPGDRRGLAMVGPFSFPAGSMQELDYAMITVWKNNSQSAMERKGAFIDHIRSLFNNGFAK